MRRKKIGIKDFHGSVDVTDPCYNRDVWCRMNDVKIKEGEYTCLVWYHTDKGTDNGKPYAYKVVGIIGIYLDGRIPVQKAMKEIGSIGVDAGLAGFFHNKPDYDDDAIEAVTEDFFSKSDSVCNSLKQVDVILDGSASIAVERILALDIETCAGRLSCFLNPRGTATIMLLESSDGTARLDLLEMQYYRELVLNVKYKDHMELPETKVYSGTCRSITNRISQDDVSLSASLCSKAFKIYLKDGIGKIIIWSHKDDSVSRYIFC